MIRDERRKTNLTQEALALAAGIGRATVQRVEAGAEVSFETVLAICAVLGMDARSLPGGLSTVTPVPVVDGADIPAAPTLKSRDVSLRTICMASALSAMLSILVAVGCIQVGHLLHEASVRDPLGSGAVTGDPLTRATLGILLIGGMAPLLLTFTIMTREWAWLAARVPRWCPNGPYTSAILCSLFTIFPAMVLGMGMGEGNLLGLSVNMIDVPLMSASAVVVHLVGSHTTKGQARAVLAASGPLFAALAIVIQAVGWATGAVAATAFTPLLFGPWILSRRDLTENVRVAAFLGTGIPWLQMPWVGWAIRPLPSNADMATIACCLAVDAAVLAMALRLRNRAAVPALAQGEAR